jgi:MoaA/NifB/PqqE/SkfB family radical SAM enzyme
LAIQLDVPVFSWAGATEEDRSVIRYFGFYGENEIRANTGKLLMLDLDFGRECSLRCPTCFRRSNRADDTGGSDLRFEEWAYVLGEAQQLGLREVKICGAGEPFENPQLLHFVRFLTSQGLGVAIFTKGHVFGDDALARSVFGHEGIRSGADLAATFFDLKTSLLVGFQSFHADLQDALVGNVRGYSKLRNHALEILCTIGFNKAMPTRLALCLTPITRANYGEVFEFYVFCRERNILPVAVAPMVSGRQFTERFLGSIDVPHEEKLDLWRKIYQYNIETGIQSRSTIIRQGISPMVGIHPCNQIAAGLYVTANGNVLNCPGDDQHPIGNVKDEGLSSIWRRSENSRRYGRFNCGCPYKDGRTLKNGFYTEVLAGLSLNDHTDDAVEFVASRR